MQMIEKQAGKTYFHPWLSWISRLALFNGRFFKIYIGVLMPILRA